MSADLLRRAAAKLREHAEAATPAPWAPSGVAGISTAIDLVDAEYVALMHPPVALALAELLQVLSWFPSAGDPTDMAVAEQLARAILREPAAEVTS